MYSFQNLNAPVAELYTHITLTLDPGKIVCLTGPNGSGKSTLLCQIRDLARERGESVQYLSQWTAIRKDRSPGQARRDELLRLFRFLSRDAILLLDEPTNHLDHRTMEWFLEELGRHRAALLLVTHDRRILGAAHRIYHLEGGSLLEYGGGLDLYEGVRQREREARERDLQRIRGEVKEAKRELRATLAKQEKRRNRAERHGRTQRDPKALVNFQRNRADRTESRLARVHSRRVRSLDEKQSDATESLPGTGRPFLPELFRDSGSALFRQRGASLDLSDIVPPRGESELLQRGLSFRIEAGARIGIRGPTGSGKSTLLRLLAGMEEPIRGRIYRKGNRALLLDQGLQLLEGAESPLQFMRQMTDLYETKGEGDLRTFLAGIGFLGERVFQRCETLSGGERMRLAIGGALKGGADLILLDEPTNDLDLRARDELVEILKSLRTTLVVVSHDDPFLEAIGVDSLLDLDWNR